LSWSWPKFGQVDTCPNLAVFGRLSPEQNFTIFNLVNYDKKIGHIQSSRSRPTNLVESTLTKIWLIRPWPKCGHIWQSRLWPKFGRIRQNRPLPKFSRIQLSRSRLKFCRVDLSLNLVTLSPTEICSKVIQVHPMLKFGLVGLDKKSAKFYSVNPIDIFYPNNGCGSKFVSIGLTPKNLTDLA